MQPGKSDDLPRAEGLDLAVELARKIYRRVAPANSPADVAIGITRSERSDVFDTAELVMRVDGHLMLVEVREVAS